MKDKLKFCNNCLAKLEQDGYCDACGYSFNQGKSINVIHEENFPREYYWYGVLAAPIFGFLSYFIIYSFFTGDFAMKKMGVALYFIVPLCTGAMLGYFMRPIKNLLEHLFLTLIAACTLASLVYLSGSAGLACATVLIAIFIAPLCIGIIFGRIFRRLTARHLTAQFQSSPLVFFFLLPVVYGAIEEQYFETTPRRTVETQVIIEARQSQVWKTIRFYEHVKQSPPLILKLGLPIPLRAIGNHKKVGEITSCEYEGGGFIKKKITQLIEQEELTFEVIEQSIHFEHDLKLYGGSILLSAIGEGKHTIITMRTHYESYVRPSWLWETSMDYVIKTLHKYVIRDMQNELGGNVVENDSYSKAVIIS